MASAKRRDPKRGRRKAARSPETVTWNRAHLSPEQPGYLDAASYHALVKLRNQIEREP